MLFTLILLTFHSDTSIYKKSNVDRKTQRGWVGNNSVHCMGIQNLAKVSLSRGGRRGMN